MKRAIRQILPIAALLAVFALLPAQSAFGASNVIRDCAQDGAVNGDYSRSELNAALGEVRGDVAEYTDCRSAITAAIAALGSGGGGPKANIASSGDKGAADLNDDGVVTPAERRAIAAKKAKGRHDRRELASIGDSLTPDGGGLGDSGGSSSGGISTPLLLTLIVLAALGIGGGTWYAARRYPAVANALSRVPLPLKRG